MLDQSLMEAHAGDDVDGGTANVDRITAGAQLVCAFDDRDVPACLGKPERQNRAGDARAGDQSFTCHGSPTHVG